MAYMGSEIIQSRRYVSDKPVAPPNANYKLTFPITVYEAVRRNINDPNSITLDQDIDNIKELLNNKQNLIPAKSANHIVTYAGAPGFVSSVKMIDSISWDPDKWSNNRIPTEKAVGDLLVKYGLGENNNPGGSNPVSWASIVGKPKIYDTLGDDQDGLISQKGLSDTINKFIEDLQLMDVNISEEVDELKKAFIAHKENKNNPHDVTIEQLGAVSKDEFKSHKNNQSNPHNVTKEQVGLGNVDNTADKDKPISILTQSELDKINKKIQAIDESTGLMNFITKIEYNQVAGRLDAIYNDGSRKGVNIITNGLVDEIEFNESDATLLVRELSGITKKVSLAAIHNKYTGSDNKHIHVKVENNIVSASINPKSITSDELSDKVISSKHIEDGSITGNKLKENSISNENLQDKTIKGNKIADNTITSEHLRNMSITLNKMVGAKEKNAILITKAPNSTPVWGKIDSGMIADGLIESKHIKDQTINNTKIADYTISSEKLLDKIISTRKIEDKAVTSDKIQNGAITGDNISPSISFKGSPSLENNPSSNSNDKTIVSSFWVKELLNSFKISDNNINDHFINGKHLFTSRYKNRALVIDKVDGEAYWGKINEDMLEDGAIDGSKLKDESITFEKIKDNNILFQHIKSRNILSEHIKDGAVTSEKIFQSDHDNMVLAAAYNNRHPIYTKVIDKMLAKDAVKTESIADESVTLDKLARVGDADTVLVNRYTDRAPEWGKIVTDMINPFSITSSRLYKSSQPNMVLGTKDADSPAYYTKINGNMLENNIIRNEHIVNESIDGSKLIPNSIDIDRLIDFVLDGTKIRDRSIGKEKLKPEVLNSLIVADNSIDGKKLFKPTNPYTLLGVNNNISLGAQWIKFNPSKMIEDFSIPMNKIKPELNNNQVKAGILIYIPNLNKYSIIDLKDILENEVGNSELQGNLAFKGNPTIVDPIDDNKNDDSIATTSWVNKIIDKKLQNFSGGNANVEGIDKDRIRVRVAEALADLDNLDPNGNIKNTIEQIVAEYIQAHYNNLGGGSFNGKIKTENIEDKAVTTDKIAPDSIDTDHIVDKAISGDKIDKHSIEHKHIKSGSLQGDVLVFDTELPPVIKVGATTQPNIYQIPIVRNVVLSSFSPIDFTDKKDENNEYEDIPNGTIWIQYE